MEQISYSSFSNALHRDARRAKAPTNVTFELTRRCPLSCQHCYNNLPVGDRTARDGELSTAEHLALLDGLTELGPLWLLYTGGEIFARPDFMDIYTHAKSRGFIITLFTNATLITPAIADRLAELPPFAIEVTLYGATRETYETVTGIAGSYDRCLRGIRLLQERKLPLKLKTVALTINRHEIEAMKRFASELGVDFKFDSMMSPRIDCSLSPLDVRLAPEECVELDLRDPARMTEWGQFAEKFMGPARPTVDPNSVYHCGGGVSAFSIDPYGQMSICVLSEQDKYDLRAGSLSEGWNHFLRAVRARTITKQTKCTTCELKPMCGMCPASGELENGDPEAPVDFLCQVAHLRAHALGLPVPPHGDCEYCAGGSQVDALAAAFERLKAAATLPAAPIRRSGKRAAGLVVLGEAAASEGCGSGACGSCGDH